MKVSIVTATYNGVETLAYAAESIFSQTYPNIEYIIVDGGFSDGTINLVKSFGQKVDIFISEHDHGIYHAINKGLEVSSGDIVGLLYADDQLAGPEVISKIVQIFRETDCDAVYGDLQYVSRTDGSRIIRYWKSSKFNKGLIHKGWMPPRPTLYIRRELFEKHGPYNSLYQIASDYDFILKLIEDPQLRVHRIIISDFVRERLCNSIVDEPRGVLC